jgi:hypothetical protein
MRKANNTIQPAIVECVMGDLPRRVAPSDDLVYRPRERFPLQYLGRSVLENAFGRVVTVCAICARPPQIKDMDWMQPPYML